MRPDDDDLAELEALLDYLGLPGCTCQWAWEAIIGWQRLDADPLCQWHSLAKGKPTETVWLPGDAPASP